MGDVAQTQSAIDKWREAEGRRNRPEKPDDPVVKEVLGTIYHKRKRLVPTIGSQRRCYHGCYHPDDWKEVWGNWCAVEYNRPESRLSFWTEPMDSSKYKYKWEPNK